MNRRFPKFRRLRWTVQIVIVTPIRLLADGLVLLFQARKEFSVVHVTDTLSELESLLRSDDIGLVLVDTTQIADLEEIRLLALAHPDVVLVALGLRDQRQDVIRCGRAGFGGYVCRDCTADDLVKAMKDAIAGKLSCPEEVSGNLLRALFQAVPSPPPPPSADTLTQRETDVMHLIGRGYTNKEIARDLKLSVSTVKHHVHNVLDKMQLPRRGHVMRQVRERPWTGV